jgi:hypothetical protein
MRHHQRSPAVVTRRKHRRLSSWSVTRCSPADGRNGFHAAVETVGPPSRLHGAVVLRRAARVPTLPSGKVDRKAPSPTGARYLANASEMVPDNTPRPLASRSANGGVGRAVEAHSSTPGANSLLLAQFCARARPPDDTPARKNTVA